MDSHAEYAFVSTNSIVQGEQVSLLWPIIYSKKANIKFAYNSFKWTNNAKNNAGVTCVIIGITLQNKERKLYINDRIIVCSNINPYLLIGQNNIVKPISKSISNLPLMQKGCAPGDGGNLLLTQEEKDNLLNKYPILNDVIKPFLGADEIINAYKRYCLWFYNKDFKLYQHIEEIKDRVDKCRIFREHSSKEATIKKALIPYLFDEIRYYNGLSIVIPQTSSEKRKYIPIFIGNDDIVYSNGARVIYNASLWLFGVLSSRIHNNWVHIVSGRLETRIQYSNTLCYNTFPFPVINEAQKAELEELAQEVLDVRDQHFDMTLGEQYNPETMPEALKEVHHRLDLAVERCYRPEPFSSDEERLECLFKLYAKMTKK